LRHSAQRWRDLPRRSAAEKGAATLGNNRKIKTTLKELCQGGGGFDATPSELMNLRGWLLDRATSASSHLEREDLYCFPIGDNQ
jgi:hypothetical protein